MQNEFAARSQLLTGQGEVTIFRLTALEDAGCAQISRLPYSVRILLEAALRCCDGSSNAAENVEALADWRPEADAGREIAFKPARVLLQDFTGIPALVDLAAMRDALAQLGADPAQIDPRVPSDLVIDHSVQVDECASRSALRANTAREFERNSERYSYLKWSEGAFRNLRVVPPSRGIVHQINLEYLATVVAKREMDTEVLAFPDSVVGTDSHTTTINGLGVLGWGVGGIEAEAVMLGRPIHILQPCVVGMKLTGRLTHKATATDLALTLTEMLRRHGVVGKFVEYFGDGVDSLSLPDRATIANMAPEYGATVGFFPVDAETVRFLQRTARSRATTDLVELYCREQRLLRTPDSPKPEYTQELELDLGDVVPSLAGPSRPQDLFALSDAAGKFRIHLQEAFRRATSVGQAPELAVRSKRIYLDGGQLELRDGAVVIAAITSCINTSNPSVMLGAGLLAKKAVERGLDTRPWVKTSLAPGSRVVTRYLAEVGLLPYLEALGFHVVGYGCATCIGNSGPLRPQIAEAIRETGLVACAVLSGNRNYEGRIHPLVRASYLASPPLVVAYALAGAMSIDLATEPIGCDRAGRPVHLSEIWPSQREIAEALDKATHPEPFSQEYEGLFDGGEEWRSLEPAGDLLYNWDDSSTYIRRPPFFDEWAPEPPLVGPINGARALAVLGDCVTTDHISPAGAIAADSPAGQYLATHGVEVGAFNTYGSRRGNHEVMVRGTFANARLRNELATEEGGFTTHLPTGEATTIFEAALRYRDAGIPLVVLAGAEYGSGSSRDWAAKGVRLLGVRAVIAESYERIHRSNLVGMGVLPLQFPSGESRHSLELSGHEIYDIELHGPPEPGQRIGVAVSSDDGAQRRFQAICRIDSTVEAQDYQNGGTLQTIVRSLLENLPSKAVW